MIVLDAYQMAGAGSLPEPTTSAPALFSPWTYERHVPQAFCGAPLVAGEYHGYWESAVEDISSA